MLNLLEIVGKMLGLPPKLKVGVIPSQNFKVKKDNNFL